LIKERLRAIGNNKTQDELTFLMLVELLDLAFLGATSSILEYYELATKKIKGKMKVLRFFF
jgi:hypothetical protein